MKLLHTSDWHLGKSLYDFPLLEDQAHMLDGLLELLEREAIDAVLIAGDIYDRPVPSAQAVALYDRFLAGAVMELGIPVLAVAGNHDSPARLEFGSRLYSASGYHICGHPRAGLHKVTLEDRHGPVDFWLLPFLHPADVRALFPELLDIEKVRTFDGAYRVLLEQSMGLIDQSRRNVCIAHGFFASIGGAPSKEYLTSDSEVSVGGMDIADSGVFSLFDYTALGHLHAPQRAGSETVRYAGSPLKYSLSEERQQKSFTLVVLEQKGHVRCSFLPVEPLRDVRTVSGSLEQLLEPAFHKNQHLGDYVFAYLSDNEALYPMEKLRKLFPYLLGLRFASGDEPARPLRVGEKGPKLSPEEMFLRFFREIKGFDMPEDYIAYLVETLASSGEDRP